jgi:hypothetical protein
MHVCQVNTHVCISLVGAHHKFPSLRNSKVNPRDRDLGAKEFFPQVNPCGLGQVGRILVAFLGLQLLMKKFGNLPIPVKLRNAPTKLMKEVGYGEGYELYDRESYLPDNIKTKRYLPKRSSA